MGIGWLIPRQQLTRLLGRQVVALADAFENFMDQFPAKSTEKMFLEDGSRGTLAKLKSVKIINSRDLISNHLGAP